MNVLINSASYINAEMEAEFGALPPAFLPLGTRRLLEHQIDSLRVDGTLFLSLPESFQYDRADGLMLERLGVKVIRVPDRIPLGEAVHFCLQSIDSDQPLQMLHGDTLLTPPPFAIPDTWALSYTQDGYLWGYAKTATGQIVDVVQGPPHEGEEGYEVLCGYFQLSRPRLLESMLIESDFDFIGALAQYCQRETVRSHVSVDWSDFGHLQTYYRSKAAHASARAFNRLAIGSGVVRKSSDNGAKIRAEAEWYARLPPALAPYTARLIQFDNSENDAWYTTEYEYLPTLQELYVFGRLGRGPWRNIVEACTTCLQAFATHPASDRIGNHLHRLAVTKTLERMATFEGNSGIFNKEANLAGSLAPSIRTIAGEMFNILKTAQSNEGCVMHGDFCFSNLMFNSRNNRVRLIDPRGAIDENFPSVAGDFRYDMAKLAHSIIGNYDLLIGNRFEIKVQNGNKLGIDFLIYITEDQLWLADVLRQHEISGVRFDDSIVSATMILLFISMLPLHSESPQRQLAFIANIFRLYLRLF